MEIANPGLVTAVATSVRSDGTAHEPGDARTATDGVS